LITVVSTYELRLLTSIAITEMLPDVDEPTMTEIMSKYVVLANRLREIKTNFPYTYVDRPGGTALIFTPINFDYK
jgi:hypothetical protein